MHSDTVDKSASPRKRIVSRGMSEEESLRHVIEAEESPKRLTRRDSRYGSLRRGDTRGSQSEDEPVENTSSMMELQQNYEMCLAELHSVELRQEVLLFQVECLQDALEGAEEMLTETKREADQFSMELERERAQRRKLEDTVALLTQELERLKEEKISVPAESIIQDQKEAVDMTAHAAVEVDECGPEETLDKSVDTVSPPAGSPSSFATFAAATYLLFKNRKLVPDLSKQSSLEGTPVDQEAKAHMVDSEQAVPEGSSQKAHDAEDNDENSGYEDAQSDFSPGSSTPDEPSDAVLQEGGESEPKTIDEARNGKDPDACLLS
ncbi:uncharacterized protein si:ch1073-456m8.1 [Neoarius graeffei]|uniref:uncharacterized protein si:ch1073-456m8.1 n=1 Tax=Neoarius graeffei TaxID=443677 RepID=UPI00298C0EF9|nr:uncharacterized protein si:ch1073-456m8.1 [Neoarius graeffei]